MANIYDQNVKLQAIADAITNQSITITTGQDLLNALADIANAMQPAAANISYDNTNSGLQAVNVQQAVDENADNISTLNSSKQDVIKYKIESLTFTSGHREVRLSDLGLTVNHLINVYSYSTGYDITFNYEANGTVNMVCRSDTTYSGDLNIIIVYV